MDNDNFRAEQSKAKQAACRTHKDRIRLPSYCMSREKATRRGGQDEDRKTKTKTRAMKAPRRNEGHRGSADHRRREHEAVQTPTKFTVGEGGNTVKFMCCLSVSNCLYLPGW